MTLTRDSALVVPSPIIGVLCRVHDSKSVRAQRGRENIATDYGRSR
ncbi:MAG: hypothetical protein ACTHYD_02925 [Canibacter sp.]